MADTSSKRAHRRGSRVAKPFAVAINDAYERDASDFVELADHQTWPWYVVMLGNALQEMLRPHVPNLSPSRAEVVVASALQVIGVLRVMFIDEHRAPKPELVVDALKAISPTDLAFERLSYYLIAELQKHLNKAFEAEGERVSLEQPAPPSRRPPRDRSNLPDPTEPAWANVNRMSAKKIQIPCRIEPSIKPLIEEDAEKLGITQSRWLEEAIAEKLQRQGHAVALKEVERSPKKKKLATKPRRVQRPSVPNPEKSVDASENRADKSTTTRMGERLVGKIDEARGEKDRSAWMNEAIRAFLEAEDELPKELDALEALAEPVGLRFDRNFFPVIEAAKKNSGITYSEWYRRVARWYLDQ